MEKEIYGKIYELVENAKTESVCRLCAFSCSLHGCKIGVNECSLDGNEDKYWRLKSKINFKTL